MKSIKSFFVSIPHSGEQVPKEASWLNGLPEVLLMSDVDRFVDQLYAPILKELEIPTVMTEWHRYAVDLNRLAEDVDQDSVEGSVNPPGKFTQGLHWVRTMNGEVLMKRPISAELHQKLVTDYFEPFHENVRARFKDFKAKGFHRVFHIDAHSMPSLGTTSHRDPGQQRKDVVVSDFLGKSCSQEFKDLVIDAFEKAGFEVGYNFPYIGGRVTQTYGHPDRGQESIQVELNRRLYMDEKTKKMLSQSAETQQKIARAMALIHKSIQGDRLVRS